MPRTGPTHHFPSTPLDIREGHESASGRRRDDHGDPRPTVVAATPMSPVHHHGSLCPFIIPTKLTVARNTPTASNDHRANTATTRSVSPGNATTHPPCATKVKPVRDHEHGCGPDREQLDHYQDDGHGLPQDPALESYDRPGHYCPHRENRGGEQNHDHQRSLRIGRKSQDENFSTRAPLTPA